VSILSIKDPSIAKYRSITRFMLIPSISMQAERYFCRRFAGLCLILAAQSTVGFNISSGVSRHNGTAHTHRQKESSL